MPPKASFAQSVQLQRTFLLTRTYKLRSQHLLVAPAIRCITGEQVALKLMRDVVSARREEATLRALSHVPGVVELLDSVSLTKSLQMLVFRRRNWQQPLASCDDDVAL